MNIAQGLSIFYIGAQNETLEQLDKLLNFNILKVFTNLSKLIVSRGNVFLKKRLKKFHNSVTLVSLNRIYVHRNDSYTSDINFVSQFVNMIDKYFRSSIEFLDFNKKNESLNKINDWITRKTDERLRYIVEECDLNPSGIILLNACYFCGKWKTPFKICNTLKKINFYLSDGNIEKVDMMHQYNERYKYIENVPELSASVCLLPYEHKKLSMMIILPHEDVNIALVESKLSADVLRQVDKQFKTFKINVGIPIFKLHIKTEVKMILVSYCFWYHMKCFISNG